jgi:signal transduction histidine kinase
MFPKTNAKSQRRWQDPGAPGAIDLRTLRELCHDLTVPATAIKLLTQVAVAESDPGPAMRARLRQISDEASRIADICSYFLDQPTDAGAAPADEKAADLHILAAEAADSMRWRYTGLVTVSADPVTVAAHPVVVVRILTNLLDNACRAAGPGGRVQVTVRRDGEQARLVIADSGPGFGQAESGKASLGLSIVAAMVRRGGGSLRMGASDLGGIAVTVTLPGAEPDDRAPSLAPAKGAAG